MEIEKASEEDAELLDEVIKEEFPYTSFNPEKISEKLNDERFFILKAHQKNIFVGFMEMEFLEGGARVNGLFVEDAWRSQKVATKLVKKCMHECKRKRIHRIFLLVRKNNLGAKHLYKELGFEFEKKHDKKLDGIEVEVWSTKIN